MIDREECETDPGIIVHTEQFKRSLNVVGTQFTQLGSLLLKGFNFDKDIHK